MFDSLNLLELYSHTAFSMTTFGYSNVFGATEEIATMEAFVGSINQLGS